MSNSRNQDKNKDGKEAKSKAEKARKGSGTATAPGFAKGAFTMQANRTWQVRVMCLNGNPEKNFVTTVAGSATYYGGGAIPDPADTTLFLPDSVNIDASHIFPWDPRDADPLRLGGGVIKGIVIEGSQRQDAGPRDPIHAPFIVTEWVNGAPYHMTVEIPAAFGITFFPGESAFALITVDPVSRQPIVNAVAKSEGNCLDLPVA